MSKVLNVPLDVETKQLIEGHPIGVSKIIQGDLRERVVNIEGAETVIKSTDGKLLYDRHDPLPRPWFVLVYESGDRIVD